MKGQMVGDVSTTLLWPNEAIMSELRSISRPYNHLVSVEAESVELLWPSSLINELARLRKRKNPALIISVIAFVLSLILTIIAGPVQLALIATMLDYDWVATVYYPNALQYLLPISSLVAILTLIAIMLCRRAQPRTTRTIATLACGTLTEIALLWLFGNVITVQPHVLSLVFITIAVISIVFALFIHKQYTTRTENSQAMKIFLGFLLTIAAFEILLGPFYLIESTINRDTNDFDRIAADQAAAQVPGVSEILSNMTFALCGGKYQVVYLSENSESGIFECNNNHEVYSIENLGEHNLHSIRGAATYLGTTYNKDLSLDFPTSYYLYRDLSVLPENELALMVAAHSEKELIDNFTEPLLNYWQTHHDKNLFVNIFYNDNISSMNYTPPGETKLPSSYTRNYVLMAAMGIMAMTDQLPSGNSHRYPLNGEMINYVFEPDKKLTALGKLGSRPELYSQNSRDALKLHRFISVHLDKNADANIDFDTLRTKLENSFTSSDDIVEE